MEFIDVQRQGSVAVMFWRHEEQNRFTTPFIREILQALEDAKCDEKVAGVVIASGLEKYFSTGLYLEWIVAQAQKDLELVREFLGLLNWMLITLTSFPKPLIAAINGHAVGAGCIAAACMDFRLMTEDQGFVRLPEVQINIPFWPGMTAIFHSIVPPSGFRDMAYTGDRFTAIQAKRLGYIDEHCRKEELLTMAVDLATKLGGANWRTYAAIKQGNRRSVLRIMEEEDPKAIGELIDRMKEGGGLAL